MRRCLVVLLALAMAAGCAATEKSPPRRPARINHIVFFKLKNPADKTELLRDCDRDLASIPGVVSYFSGTHLDTGRANVDSDYDVGFYVGFEDEAAHAEYVKHPAHVAAVNKWRPRWEWIRIHDVIDETP